MFRNFIALVFLSSTAFLPACDSASASRPADDDGLASTGRTYFLDAASGDDTRDGTSQETAWRSLGRLEAVSLEPGDSVLLKRGGRWRETLVIESVGTEESPIAFAAYGEGDAPVVSGSETVSDWTLVGDSYVAQPGWESGVIVVDRNPLNFIAWDGAMSAPASPLTTGSYSVAVSGDDIGKAYIRLPDDSSPLDHSIELSRRDYSLLIKQASHIEVKELIFEHARLHCVFVEDGDNIRLTGLTIRHCGGMWFENAEFYVGNGVEWTGTSRNLILEQSTVEGIFDSGASPQLYNSGDTVDGVEIRDNVFVGNGFNAVEISIHPPNDGSIIRNVTIANNLLKETGLSWSGMREGSAIYLYNNAGSAATSQIEGVVIQGNTITANAKDGIFVGTYAGRVRIEKNSISANGGRGILVYDTLSQTSTGLDLTQNLIYGNTAGGLVYHVPEGAGFSLLNNIFHDNGSDAPPPATFNLYLSAAAGEKQVINNILYGVDSACLYVEDVAAIAPWDASHNLYYRHDGGAMIGYAEVAYFPGQLSAYQSASGVDVGSLEGDPEFIDAAGGNFQVSATSPAMNGGVDAGLSTDFIGQPIPQGSGPDIGPYEQ